jgi:hypothetical protein
MTVKPLSLRFLGTLLTCVTASAAMPLAQGLYGPEAPPSYYRLNPPNPSFYEPQPEPYRPPARLTDPFGLSDPYRDPFPRPSLLPSPAPSFGVPSLLGSPDRSARCAPYSRIC